MRNNGALAEAEGLSWRTNFALATLAPWQMPARAIDSKLTAMGKDERAISVSGYVHRGLVKYTDRAFDKTVIYKRNSRNHLVG